MQTQQHLHSSPVTDKAWTRRELLLGVGGGGTNSSHDMGTNSSSGANVPLPTAGTFKAPVKLDNTSTANGTYVATLTAAATNVQLAATGAATTVWAYNGVLPGPMIDVKEGDTVTITLKNQLPQASTIHWHGLPVPPDQDGNPMDPVAAGASRSYTFTLPVGSAGTYWFHPHPHETTHEQVFRGLAGCFIVRPAIDPLAALPERVMVVTDLRLDANNQIAPNTDMDRMNGREGNNLLVNGVQLPTLVVQPGTSERWRIINATNARYLRLSLANHTMKVVAHDGGYIEAPQTVTETLLAPAQRVEVVIEASSLANQNFTLSALAYNRGAMMMAPAPTNVALLTLNTGLAGTATPATLPQRLRSIAALNLPVRTQAIVLQESMGMMGRASQFLINNRSFDPTRVDLVTRLNDIEDWTVENQGDMDHPFHIHGTQFQLVSSTRTDTTPGLGYRAWIDTINVRAKEKVTVRIQQTMLGKRMFHCHILEHEDQGMMGVLDVQP